MKATYQLDAAMALDGVRTDAARALDGAGEFLLEQSNRTAPIEEGTLVGSGSVHVDRDALVATVSYDTPYAVRQHEDTRLRHDRGRRAKWLQLTFVEQANRLEQFLARQMGSR